MNQLAAVDSRRRQVVVNVKIIDVNLTSLNEQSSSFSFGINDTFVASDGGATVINFGSSEPARVDTNNSGISGFPGGGRQGIDFSRRFLAQLRATVQSGGGKILTDPSITVQEGQTAQINLTQEVFGGLRLQQSAVGAGGTASIQTEEPIIKQAGLIVNIKVDRIDDNGFVSLSVAPTVSSPGDTVNAGDSGNIVLLNQRSLSSGQIRMRDGQTLILSGIIQDNDRTTVEKVPILGDIPLLGALFRRTIRNGARQEVIVLLTPQILNDSDQATWGYGYTPSPNAKEEIQRDRVLNPYRQRQQSAPQQQQTPGQQQPPGSRIQQQIPAQPQSPAPSQR
jgi:type IV pilus assembly protein PilQ